MLAPGSDKAPAAAMWIHRLDNREGRVSATAASSHLPPLGVHGRVEVGEQLRATLVELVDLSSVGKQMHWTVVGPLFRPLHLQLDEMIDTWRELGDTVAERAVTIGFIPDGQSAAVAAESPSRGVLRSELEDTRVVRDLTARLAEGAERARGRIDRLGELDAATQDVLLEVVRALEEQLWMIRAQLGDRGER